MKQINELKDNKLISIWKMIITFLLINLFTNCGNVNAIQLPGNFLSLLDHFNPQNHQNVRFTYEYNTDFYKKGGPLFIYVNDGLSHTNEWIHSGLMVDIAKDVNAALITTDHRYFRFNLPTTNLTYENLRYLNVEQNLADLNSLINSVKVDINDTSIKVIVWGTAYGGLLATLARQKYPNSIHSVWSSNGIFEPMVFNKNFFQQLAKNIKNIGGDVCYNRLSMVFQQINNEIISLNDTLLVNEFRICRPWNINRSEDVTLFIEGLLNFIDQYIQKHQRNGVVNFCLTLNSNIPNPLKSFARWIRYENNGDLSRCLNFDYEEKKRWLSDVMWHMPGTTTGLRQWLYLQCTELGQFRILTNDSIFGNALNEAFYYKLCKDSFGPQYNFERLFDTIEIFKWLYGGKKPGITNAIFTNGNLNGFLNETITEYNDPNSFVINIDHTTKDADLSSINTFDSAALNLAKNTISQLIRKWV